MARLGRRRRSRALLFLLGILAIVAMFASFGTPKAGCSFSADDEDEPTARDADADVPVAGFVAIRPEAFCPTAGRVSPTGAHALHVEAAGMRGVVASDASRSGELAFVFRGPSATTVPLANGELRQQIGLKLRAQDSCNVVYVMWHVAPKPGVWVSVKSNPGQATHAECGDRGYLTPRPARSASAPAIAANEPHTLRAELEGATMTVHADGVEVWKGTLPDEVFGFDGAVGVRSDNGTFDFELRVPGGDDASAKCTNPGTELAR